MPDVGRPVLNLGIRRKHLFHLFGHFVSFPEVALKRRSDIDQKLWLFGRRKQGESDYGKQGQCTAKNHRRDDQGDDGAMQCTFQQLRVRSLDRTFQDAHEEVALRVVVLAQNHTAEEGNDGQRNHHRCQNRGNHSHR